MLRIGSSPHRGRKAKVKRPPFVLPVKKSLLRKAIDGIKSIFTPKPKEE